MLFRARRSGCHAKIPSASFFSMLATIFRQRRKKKDWFAKFHFARASLCELPHCRPHLGFGFQKCLQNCGKIPCRGAKRRGNQPWFFEMWFLAERQGFEPWEPFRAQQLSRLLLSATQPSLLNKKQFIYPILAEAKGFEPPVPFQAQQFSRLSPSTTRPRFPIWLNYHNTN